MRQPGKKESPPRQAAPAPKQKKAIIYSDKSESSVDEMMADTPSNYNIPNGRLDGKSLGLKAILMHAKKMGGGVLAGGSATPTTMTLDAADTGNKLVSAIMGSARTPQNASVLSGQ